MKNPHLLVPLFSAALVAVVACGSSDGADDSVPDPNAGASGAPGSSGTPGTSGTSGTPGTSGTSGTPSTSGTPVTTPAPLTVFTMVLENHDYDEIVGKTADAPFINSLIDDYGLATNYMDSGTHPSLPNYLTMISGETQYPGFIDVNPTTYPFPVAKENLGSQLEAAKVPWRSYQESMGTTCNLATNGDYAPKHDPFLYFTDMQKTTAGLCDKNNVDFSSFAADLAAGTYRYMWITPNLKSDGHDPSSSPADFVTALKASDAWVKTTVEAIMKSTVYKNNGIIFLTWDEATGRTGGAKAKDKVPMIVISPNIKSKGFKSTTAYSHKSYLATIEDLFKLPRLATVATEPNMLEFFK